MSLLAGGHRPIGKRQFLEGSRSFNLRGAFPDFQFNAHDFLVDKVSQSKVVAFFGVRRA